MYFVIHETHQLMNPTPLGSNCNFVRSLSWTRLPQYMCVLCWQLMMREMLKVVGIIGGLVGAQVFTPETRRYWLLSQLLSLGVEPLHSNLLHLCIIYSHQTSSFSSWKVTLWYSWKRSKHFLMFFCL